MSWIAHFEDDLQRKIDDKMNKFKIKNLKDDGRWMLNVRKLGIQLFEVLFSQSNNMLYSFDLQESRRKDI